MIPATMPAALADVIRRHGGEWLTWEQTRDNEGCCEYASRELQFTATLGMARSSATPFVIVRPANKVRGWHIDAGDETEHSSSLALAMAKPLHIELSDLAAMNRPSMCSEVSRRLMALSEREREGS
jgi:hypothetical protein